MSLESELATETTLRGKLDAAKARAPDLDARRSVISFDAHTHGGKAKAELDALNKERAGLSLEIDGIEAALAEAGRRVATARRDIEFEAERGSARQVREIAVAAEARGARIAEAGRTLRDEVLRFKDDLERMSRLGAPVTGSRLVTLALGRAVFPWLREAGFDVELIPPGQRHDPVALVHGYVATATAWADKLLNGEAA